MNTIRTKFDDFFWRYPQPPDGRPFRPLPYKTSDSAYNVRPATLRPAMSYRSKTKHLAGDDWSP